MENKFITFKTSYGEITVEEVAPDVYRFFEPSGDYFPRSMDNPNKKYIKEEIKEE